MLRMLAPQSIGTNMTLNTVAYIPAIIFKILQNLMILMLAWEMFKRYFWAKKNLRDFYASGFADA